MKADDAGKLLLRLGLGVLLVFHGVAKVLGGIGFIKTMLAGAGLPEYLAYGVFVGELLAPLLVILGWYSRVGAAVIVAQMVFFFVYAHPHQFFELASSGGWQLELQGFFLITALAVVLLGPGRLAINRR